MADATIYLTSFDDLGCRDYRVGWQCGHSVAVYNGDYFAHPSTIRAKVEGIAEAGCPTCDIQSHKSAAT